LAFIGNPVIGVFHTLSAGNAGQRVPGRVVPICAWARRRGESWCAEAEEIVSAELAAIARAHNNAPHLNLFLVRRRADEDLLTATQRNLVPFFL
jgi:hypothetical protein